MSMCVDMLTHVELFDMLTHIEPTLYHELCMHTRMGLLHMHACAHIHAH